MSSPSKNKTGLEEEETTSLETLSIVNSKTTFEDKETSDEEEAGFDEDDDITFEEEEEFLWDIELIPPKSHTGDDLYTLMSSTEPQAIGEEYVMQLFPPSSIMDISTGFKTAGLNCELNTPANLVKYTQEVMNKLPHGDMFVLSEGEKNYSADFTYKHDKEGLFKKFKELFADSYVDKLKQYIGLHETSVKHKFSSQSIDELKNILIDAGTQIGYLAAGMIINPGEIGLILGKAVKTLKEVEKLEHAFSDRDALTLIKLGPNGRKVIAVGMMSYSFKYNVKEYISSGGKKVHKCDYTLDSRSLVISDQNMILKLYAKVVPQ